MNDVYVIRAEDQNDPEYLGYFSEIIEDDHNNDGRPYKVLCLDTYICQAKVRKTLNGARKLLHEAQKANSDDDLILTVVPIPKKAMFKAILSNHEKIEGSEIVNG